jgi:hypothetical protein
MREVYEYNHFLVVYALICKYNKSHLPSELVLNIKDKCDKVRRELRQDATNRKFGIGTSKSAAKRRARRCQRCYKCGKFSHEGKCSKNQTRSNSEFVTLCREGAIECKRREVLNNGGYAYLRMSFELWRLAFERNKRGL